MRVEVKNHQNVLIPTSSRRARPATSSFRKVLMTTATTSPRTNTLSLVGFIAAFMIPIAGLVLGVLALRQLRTPGNIESGAGLARWAMVIGILGTLVQVIFFIVWFTLFFSAFNGQSFGPVRAG